MIKVKKYQVGDIHYKRCLSTSPWFFGGRIAPEVLITDLNYQSLHTVKEGFFEKF